MKTPLILASAMRDGSAQDIRVTSVWQSLRRQTPVGVFAGRPSRGSVRFDRRQEAAASNGKGIAARFFLEDSCPPAVDRYVTNGSDG